VPVHETAALAGTANVSVGSTAIPETTASAAAAARIGRILSWLATS